MPQKGIKKKKMPKGFAHWARNYLSINASKVAKKRAITKTPKLESSITIWTISKNFHIYSHQGFGDHCKKEKSNREIDTKQKR